MFAGAFDPARSSNIGGLYCYIEFSQSKVPRYCEQRYGMGDPSSIPIIDCVYRIRVRRTRRVDQAK